MQQIEDTSQHTLILNYDIEINQLSWKHTKNRSQSHKKWRKDQTVE